VGVVVGLLLGAGVACVWWSWWAPTERSDPRRPGWSARTRDTLVQAGMDGVTPGALVLTSVGFGIVALLVGVVITRVPSIALCFGVFAGLAPSAVVRGRARRRRARLRQLWPEVVDHLASGIRAGLSLPEAVAQIAERGPVELRTPFLAFAEDYRATGRFGDCLDALKLRLADPVADRIVESLRLTRDVGGTDLGRLLRTLSTFLRDDLRTRGELEARQSWTVYAARLAVAAPWIVLALLSTRPEAAQAYDTARGLAVLLTGGACTVVAYLLMLRIARLPEDPRVLR
jgi:tight adherence protein B